jgi:hypothetical protein
MLKMKSLLDSLTSAQLGLRDSSVPDCNGNRGGLTRSLRTRRNLADVTR